SVTVYLTSSDTNKITVPDSVVIPVGQTNAAFDLNIIDNALLDGDQAVNITANSQVCVNTPSKQITVHDNETATLSVTLPPSVPETAGGTVYGSVGIVGGATAGADIPVTVTSSDTSRLLLARATISKGQTSGAFNMFVVDNNISEGSTNVTVTAHISN